MDNRNTCYTSFKIVGNFDPDVITELLGLTPERFKRIGEVRRDGEKYTEALFEIGKCTEYDPITDNQMRKTIAVLVDKVEALNKIREACGASFYLVVVPTVYPDGISPSLAPSLEVIDFCHATRTEIDIDMYICDPNEN